MKVDRRKKKASQPLQEVRELFPNPTVNVRKSTVKRNPLNFKRNTDKTFSSNLRSRGNLQCSQDISLYPSTCAPRSRRRRDNCDDSDDCSITDEDDVESQEGLNDTNCRDNRVADCTGDGEADKKFDGVRSGDRDRFDDCSLSEGNELQVNETTCRECPSLSNDHQLAFVTRPDFDDDRTVPSASQQIDNEESVYFDNVQLRLRLSPTTQLTGIHSRSQLRKTTGEIDEQSAHESYSQCGVNREDLCEDSHNQSKCPVDSTRNETNRTLSCSERADDTKGVTVCATGIQAGDSFNPSASYSATYGSMENISELMKDMSVGDDVIDNSIHHTMAAVSIGDNSSLQNVKQTPALSRVCQSGRPFASQVVSCSRTAHETPFKPPVASTPFRDQSSWITQQSSCRGDDLLNSPNACLSTTRPADMSVGCSQTVSVLVKETPEHMWCSPELGGIEKRRLKIDRNSFQISDSVFQQSCGDSVVCNDETQSMKQPACESSHYDIDNFDMTTFNNFDDTKASRCGLVSMDTTRSVSTTCTADAHEVMCSVVPPTQDSTHDDEGEWSILAKQTPDDLWCSPVVKVIENSF